MSKYGKIAVEAINFYNEEDISIQEAWSKACAKYYSADSASFKKACPKNTFLGLCEEGFIIGVPKGNYTRSEKNKKYAIKALQLIKDNPKYCNDKIKLWKNVVNENKTHNSQMDVVIELYKNNMIINTKEDEPEDRVGLFKKLFS